MLAPRLVRGKCMSVMFDTTNIQDVFATTSVLESAGGGNTRIYNCIMKNGVLIPVGYAIVYPTVLLLKAVQGTEEFVRRQAAKDMASGAIH